MKFGALPMLTTTPYTRRALGGVSAAAGFDPFWLPVVYERLGDLYERRDDAAKASHYYGKLVELWKEADPELQPRVEAARLVGAALTGLALRFQQFLEGRVFPQRLDIPITVKVEGPTALRERFSHETESSIPLTQLSCNAGSIVCAGAD